MKKWVKLVLSIVLVLAVGYIGSAFTANSVNSWYETLNKPSFNPPNWIFAPVWTILYIMIGFSLYLVIVSKAKSKIKKKAYWIFGIQLFLNGIWSIVFFGMQNILGALFVIILLWIAILMNILAFYKISKLASYFLLPYWLWVSFASVLNFSIRMLNR